MMLLRPISYLQNALLLSGEEEKHFAHIEPFQAPEIPQTSFHIILDMEKNFC
jgi:hypothetical protein